MKAASTGRRHPVVRDVEAALKRRRLLSPAQTVVVAVSGGPDSVALLSLLQTLAPAWALTLSVVHCHYGLRGAESDEDARFVTDLCRRFELPCVVVPLTVTARPAGASSSLQARARDARYAVFHAQARHLGAARVALGHTADDQAETVLLHLLRGTGLRGLAGMAPLRERLFIRPLLTVSRAEILDYLAACDLPYRTDSSNATDAYTRNRVRRELLPLLHTFNPAITRLLARQADVIRADDRLLDGLALRLLAKLTRRREAGELVLDRAQLVSRPSALQRRIVRLALRSLAAPAPATVPRHDLLHSLLDAVGSQGAGGRWVIGPMTITCESKDLVLRRIERASSSTLEAADGYECGAVLRVDSLPATLTWSATGETIQIRCVSARQGRAWLQAPDRSLAVFDADRLPFPLTVRSWRPGDWFCPLGMNGRRKKLQDHFTDAKLGRSMRERKPLLLSRDGVAWIVGERIDVRVAATADTTRFIVARVDRPLGRKGAR